MHESDVGKFGEALTKMFELLSGGKGEPPNARLIAMWFELLKPYSLPDLVRGMKAHMLRPVNGRTLPIPSDIVAKVEEGFNADGRPGDEEAWATALQAADEDATVVWTAETAAAWDVARVAFDRGDEVAARMAFKQAYNREVAGARQAGIRPAWAPSLGYDPARRADAVRVAVEKGLLQGTDADDLLHLTAPRAPVPLLESAVDLPDWAPDTKERIRAIRARLTAPRPDSAAGSLVERQRAADRAAALQAKVEAYAAEHSIDLGSAVPAPGEPQ